jgi:Relaxase/Mobilisation nuclease domain
MLSSDMIAKGNQRGGGQQLAAHLLNAYDNESIELADLRGAVAPDIAGAFAEWFVQSKATKAEKYLYSLSINPDQSQGKMTRDQYLDFIGRVEKRLGLQNQPRAVVFHVKQGREHCHVVWSRIDTERMRAVQLSNDHLELRSVSQEFAKDYGLELPEEMKDNRGRKKYDKKKERSNYTEKQQQERSGFKKADRVKSITDAWNTTRTAEDFIRALEAKDFYLARGDQRAYVVVDLAGAVHSLSKQIKGLRREDLTARFAGLPPGRLPGVAKAQAHARQMREDRVHQRQPSPSTGKTPDQRRQDLREKQALRRAAIVKDRQQLKLRQGRAVAELAVRQTNANTERRKKQLETKRRGIVDFLLTLGRLDTLAAIGQRFQDFRHDWRQKTERDRLQRRHDSERRDLDRRERALDRLDNRELRSLDTALGREEFQKIAAAGKTMEPTIPAPERIVALASTPIPAPEPAPNPLADEFRRAAERKDRALDLDPGRTRDPS